MLIQGKGENSHSATLIITLGNVKLQCAHYIQEIVDELIIHKDIVLEVWDETPAKVLYERQGFRHVEDDTNYLGSGVLFRVLRKYCTK